MEHQNAKLATTLSRINTVADLPLDPMAFYEDFLQVTSPERVGEAWGRLDEHIGQHTTAPTDALDHAVPGVVVEPAAAAAATATAQSPVGVDSDRPAGCTAAQQAQLGQLPFSGRPCSDVPDAAHPAAALAEGRTGGRTR